MSNFNYMDDVPVKIAESYKPLPKVFQIPQAIANKLQLPAQHYHESPHYSYDFQLEKKVLAKMPDWRRMRQYEREQRRERKQRREEQRMRALEQQHKQMLGAVNYPDAEDLSSESDTDEEEKQVEQSTYAPVTATNGPTKIPLSEEISFDNILQPTILPQSHTTQHARNKSNSSFNYKDFEEDTSSPFDNIELKTINDLDILAQVLQHAQLKANADKEDEQELDTAQESANNADVKEIRTTDNNLDNSLSDIDASERKDLNVVNQQQQQRETINIPTNFSNNFDYITQHHAQLTKQNFSAYAANQHQQLSSYMHHYNQPQQQQLFPCIGTTNFNQLQQQTYTSNHNYLYSTATCNGGSGSYNSPAHNANTYPAAAYVGTYGSPQIYSTLNATEAEAKLKAKSVPDILKELKEEVRSSEMRRARNCSYNQQEQQQVDSDFGSKDVETEALQTPHQMSLKTTTTSNQKQPSTCYNMLEATTQALAKNISSMGFPLERVAKIAQIFGADDKKIIEHLIPLSELIDLGFDESKISEALMKFDNNKEKALEYLIA